MAPKQQQGTAVVLGIVTLIFGTIGVGTIYLPFYADRDKMSGMSLSDKMEYDKTMQLLNEKNNRQQQEQNQVQNQVQQQQQQIREQQQQQQEEQSVGIRQKNNSMWGTINKNVEKK